MCGDSIADSCAHCCTYDGTFSGTFRIAQLHSVCSSDCIAHGNSISCPIIITIDVAFSCTNSQSVACTHGCTHANTKHVTNGCPYDGPDSCSIACTHSAAHCRAFASAYGDAIACSDTWPDDITHGCANAGASLRSGYAPVRS